MVGKRWDTAPSVMVHLLNLGGLAQIVLRGGVLGYAFEIGVDALHSIDRAMSTRARLALGLNRFTSSDAALSYVRCNASQTPNP